MNTKLRQKAKINFQKDFVKLMNNVVFGKTMKNEEKHRNIKPNDHNTNFFTENVLAIKKRKTQILIDELYILDIEFIYMILDDYVKSKYGENAKRCYMDTESYIVHVKTNDIDKDIVQNIETRFDTSNFEIDHYLK